MSSHPQWHSPLTHSELKTENCKMKISNCGCAPEVPTTAVSSLCTLHFALFNFHCHSDENPLPFDKRRDTLPLDYCSLVTVHFFGRIRDPLTVAGECIASLQKNTLSCRPGMHCPAEINPRSIDRKCAPLLQGPCVALARRFLFW